MTAQEFYWKTIYSRSSLDHKLDGRTSVLKLSGL
jgi:hypothetical protein